MDGDYWDDGSGFWAGAGVDDPNAGNAGFAAADEFWQDNGDGTWWNSQTGELQGEGGNTLGFQDAAGNWINPDGAPQPRDDAQPGDVVDYLTPTDVAVTDAATGGGLFSSIGNFLGNLFGGGSGSPAGSGGGSGGGFGGGGSSSSGQQQAMQKLMQQLAAAQRANASPAVTGALQRQINALGGGSGMNLQTLLIVGGVLAVGYFVATRNSRAA